MTIMTVTMLICGLATIWWGYVRSPFQYLIACAIVVSCNNGYAHICGSNLAAVWFPTRKGLFLGWSTMGIQLSAVIVVPVMNWLLTSFGISQAYLFFGIVQLVLAVVIWFTVRNTPEEVGKYPDNIPMTEEELANYRKKDESSTWSVLALLKNRQVYEVRHGATETSYARGLGAQGQSLYRHSQGRSA